MLNSIVEYVATLLAFIIVDHDEGWKPTLFNNGISSKLVVSLAFDLEDKITFKGVGNDIIHVVLVQCLLTNMLYNEKIIGDIKDVEVEKLEKTKHKRINRKVCCFNNDNNKFLVNEFDPNWRLMNTLNGNKNLLDWHYNYSPLNVIDAVEGHVNLHYNCVLPIVRKHMRSNKVLSGMFEGKVSGIGVTKIVISLTDGCETMHIIVSTCGCTSQVKMERRKKWDPGWNLIMCITSWSSKFKQWDPGKICAMSNFYNLEDKVDFEGVGNVMIL
jgi:hypothetical protein